MPFPRLSCDEGAVKFWEKQTGNFYTKTQQYSYKAADERIENFLQILFRFHEII